MTNDPRMTPCHQFICSGLDMEATAPFSRRELLHFQAEEHRSAYEGGYAIGRRDQKGDDVRALAIHVLKSLKGKKSDASVPLREIRRALGELVGNANAFRTWEPRHD